MRTQTLEFSGYFVDIFNGLIFPVFLFIVVGKIDSIVERANVPSTYLLPEFIDAHATIESSLRMHHEFVQAAVIYGTVAMVFELHAILVTSSEFQLKLILIHHTRGVQTPK